MFACFAQWNQPFDMIPMTVYDVSNVLY